MRKARVIKFRKENTKKKKIVKITILLFIFVLKSLMTIFPIILSWKYVNEYGFPNFLITYTYKGDLNDPYFTSCTYWGLDGEKTIATNLCPIIVFIKEE